jgi:hypothetical protein
MLARGLNALALGKSSRPRIPGMLIRKRIGMSDTPAASMIRRSGWSGLRKPALAVEESERRFHDQHGRV